jgi:hypothetical protein
MGARACPTKILEAGLDVESGGAHSAASGTTGVSRTAEVLLECSPRGGVAAHRFRVRERIAGRVLDAMSARAI